jgi:hypothetical protein
MQYENGGVIGTLEAAMLYIADPIEGYALQQPRASDEKKLR